MPTPDFDALRQFVRTLLASESLPVTIRNECHHLLLAMEMENPDLTEDHLRRISALAGEAGIALPETPEGSE